MVNLEKPIFAVAKPPPRSSLVSSTPDLRLALRVVFREHFTAFVGVLGTMGGTALGFCVGWYTRPWAPFLTDAIARGSTLGSLSLCVGLVVGSSLAHFIQVVSLRLHALRLAHRRAVAAARAPAPAEGAKPLIDPSVSLAFDASTPDPRPSPFCL